MSLFEGAHPEWRERMLSVLRIVAGALILEHGTQKMFDVPAAARAMDYHVLSLLGAAGVIETVGGLLILVGLLTRPAAFLVSGEMAVAYFKVHIVRSFFPINNGGDIVVLFSFVFLYLVFAGPGVWSLDHVIAAARRAARPELMARASARPQPG